MAAEFARCQLHSRAYVENVPWGARLIFVLGRRCGALDRGCAVSTNGERPAAYIALRSRIEMSEMRASFIRCRAHGEGTMSFVKVTVLPKHLAVPAQETKRSSSESFEEWQARVCALDRAVREHLAPRGQQDWRYIEIPKLLDDWKANRCEASYLNLLERLMRMLEIFARAGSMSARVVHEQLCACEAFLGAQVPISSREQTLRVLARKAKHNVAAIQAGKGKVA